MLESIWEGIRVGGGWSLFGLWTLALIATWSVIFLSLPGGWIAFALVALWDGAHGFHAIGWPRLAFFAALLIVGEVVEALLGSVYVAKKGASKWAVAGTFVGGLVGAAIGSGVFPGVGTLAGVFLGGFAGAVGGELIHDRRLEPSLRVGVHATIGRMLAVLTKSLLAGAGLAVSFLAALRAMTAPA
ncbi:MAG: DUF456 domain-containing protein [bacterium]